MHFESAFVMFINEIGLSFKIKMIGEGKFLEECLENVLCILEGKIKGKICWQYILYIFKCELLIAKDINDVNIHICLTL